MRRLQRWTIVAASASACLAPAAGARTSVDPFGPLTVAPVQHGSTVTGKAAIGFDNSTFQAKLLRDTASLPVLGTLNRYPVSAGRYRFEVALNHRGRAALKRLKKLKLVLRVAVTPPGSGTHVQLKRLTLKPR